MTCHRGNIGFHSYDRGDVVFLHFGFNVGSEHGGPHAAAVVQRSLKNNPCVVVVPLGSAKLNDSGSMIPPHADERLLGVIPNFNEKPTIAHINQIRAVSKLRCFRPRNWIGPLPYLTDLQIRTVEKAIIDLYTSFRPSDDAFLIR